MPVDMSRVKLGAVVVDRRTGERFTLAARWVDRFGNTLTLCIRRHHDGRSVRRTINQRHLTTAGRLRREDVPPRQGLTSARDGG